MAEGLLGIIKNVSQTSDGKKSRKSTLSEGKKSVTSDGGENSPNKIMVMLQKRMSMSLEPGNILNLVKQAKSLDLKSEQGSEDESSLIKMIKHKKRLKLATMKTLNSSEDIQREIERLTKKKETEQKEKEEKKIKQQQIDKLLSGINPRNVEARKQLMVKQHDKILADKAKKVELLKQMQKELEEVKKHNQKEENAQVEVTAHLEQHGALANLNAYNLKKPCRTIMDGKSTTRAFDYTDIKSILEHREVLKKKLQFTEDRIQEELNYHHIYKHMIKTMIRQNFKEEKNAVFVSEEEKNLETVVQDLDMMNLIENQRKYDIEVLIY